MKKRVRYLMGAAALVPGAVGFGAVAAPTAAEAAGCTGHTSFTMPNRSGVRGHGWYTKNGNNVCIGTVVVSVWTSTTGTDWTALQVNWADGTAYPCCARYASYKVHQDAGKWGTHSYGVHTSGAIKGAANPGVSVVAWSVYTNATTSKNLFG